MTFPEFISHIEAKQLIAERTMPESLYGGMRVWKNKIDGYLKTAIKNGTIETNEDGLLLFNDVSIYAKERWKNVFADWPAIVQLSGEPIKIKFKMGEATLTVLPGTIQECHNDINELTNQNVILKKKIAKLETELALVAPKAAKWDSFCKKSGKRT